MLAPIQIKQTNTGIKALQIPIANEKKSVEKNVVSDNHIKAKLVLRKQNTNNIPSCNITSYQQEYQYQTYFIAHPYKTASAGKSTSPVNYLERFVHFNVQHQIKFLNGVAKYKQITWHQLQRYRWIINSQFHFAKKMFQTRIAQNINWSMLRLAKNYIALLVYQQQSLMFKVFLPPS